MARRGPSDDDGGGTVKKEQLDELLYQSLETERGGGQDLRDGRPVCSERRPGEGVGQIPGRDPQPRGRHAARPRRVRPRRGDRNAGTSDRTDQGRGARRVHGDRAADRSCCGAVGRRRVRRRGGDEGPHELGADRRSGQEAHRCAGEGAQGGPRRGGGAGGRAPLSHDGMGPRALARVLGLPAVLPPPEEQKHTKSAIGADRAKQARTEML